MRCSTLLNFNTIRRSRRGTGILALFFVLFLALKLQASVTVLLDAPAHISLCDKASVTNTILNTTDVMSQLMVTNQLPSTNFAYQTGLTTVLLPGGVVYTNGAAEPVIVNGTNLVWNFSSLVGTSAVAHLLITVLRTG